MATNQQDCATQLERTDGDETSLTEFSNQERERLLRLRRQVRDGERSDAYPVDKRQDFVRWLVDHGKLSDN